MSWDVLLIKTEQNNEELKDISNPVTFDRETFISAVKKDYPFTNCDDESWLILNNDEFSVEFNIGEEPIQSIILYIRGDKEPTDLIESLCKRFDCRAYDTSADKFIEANQETAFQKWKDYRNRVMKEYE